MGRVLAFTRSSPRALTQGVTLAETLLALTTLTLVMLAVLNLFPSAMANARLTRTGWLARVAAQNKIEELAGRPFGGLTVGYQEASEVQLADGTASQLETTVSAVDGHPAKLLKRVRCQVSWKGRATVKSDVLEVYVHALRR